MGNKVSIEAYDLKDIRPNDDWSNIDTINFLQKRIIVHSIIYYEMNGNVISDADFDMMCCQLVELMKSAPIEECKKSRYWYCMYDFDGVTGFDLYSRLTAKDKSILYFLQY